MNEFLESANDEHSESRMMAVFHRRCGREAGGCACHYSKKREERRERGERGGGVVRANKPRSGSERGQQSGST